MRIFCKKQEGKGWFFLWFEVKKAVLQSGYKA